MRSGHAITVTRCGVQPVTGFGVQLPKWHIRSPHLGYGTCHRDAIQALCEAYRVTIIDLAWSRDDLLWPVLARFAGLPQEAKP